LQAYLLLNAGANSGARFELIKSQQNLMGRDWECRIVLNDPQCSRVHAEIFHEDDEGWWIRDNKSSNGTYVNGQSVDQARLVDGTQVKVGASSFTFNLATASEEVSDSADNSGSEGLTIILDQSMNPKETGQYTLDFLKGQNWGQDFFFLFQLSVKLLSVDEPDQVIAICMKRLFDRTSASAAGFLWLSEEGTLTPRVFFPEDQADILELNPALTSRVVTEKRALRVEKGTGETKKSKKALYSDSICVPLVSDDQVKGAIHLYRSDTPFHDSHFNLAVALANIMIRSLDRAHRLSALTAVHNSLVQKSAAFDEMKGESPKMLELKSKIGRVAKASGSVLVRGESGAGKELVARAIHRSSPRKDRPMLSVNCAAIPRELMESQLFGHKKGSFTSADRDHIGWFQQADLGTLFLDEIGELTLEGQAKLLRTLEGHPFLPVGGTEEVSVDVRVICATNRDLKEFVAVKKFREDLFYRLSVYELYIPPLRDRESDVQMLIDFFLDHFRIQHGKPNLTLSKEANMRLLGYQWPGNVRQLRNVVDSATVMAEGDEIQAIDLGIRDATDGEFETLRIDHWERKLIIDALKRTSNNVPKASELLGISRATLYRKIDDYGVERK
jgi:transcriptional regulator with GAF, ATPase, and Fis domain